MSTISTTPKPGSYRAVRQVFPLVFSLWLLVICGLCAFAQGFQMAESPFTTNRTAIIAAPGHAFTNGSNTSTYQSAYTGGTYRKRYLCTCTANNPTFLFGNQFCEWNQVPLPALSTIQVRASIEYPVGSARIPLSFARQRTLTLQPEQTAQSDAVPVTLRKGDAFYLWVYVQGTIWPTGPCLVPTAPFYEGFTPGQDLTAGTTPIKPAITFAYLPMMVLGTPKSTQAVPVIGILGDSIACGQQDYISRGGAFQIDLGYAVRALAPAGVPGINDGYGYVRISKCGETVENFIAPNMHSLRFPLLAVCTHVICEGGNPDIEFGEGIWDFEQYLLTEWALLAQRHLQVYQCTFTPRTLSTNGWTTVQGQSIPDPRTEFVRVAINNWLRDSSPNGAMSRANGTLKGIFDIADLAETSRNSGRWRPGYTNEGQHPNSYGAALLKNGIDLSVFNH